jgi:hypothetical protein
LIRKKKQVGEVKTKIPIDQSKYPHLWFDNQEDLDRFDSLMRKKIYFQNSFGPNGEKDFIYEGTKSTFGIFSKDFTERVFKNSALLEKQLDYVSIFSIKI